jgi:EAL domain-containing protein (putative c-di-GMP-specific phosphodiesterase class I)
MEADIKEFAADRVVNGAVASDSELPPLKNIQEELRPLNHLATIAKNAWLVDALLDNRIVSFLQQVIDRRGKVFGYEAFARALNADGSQESGAAIIEASREIKIEYRVDRFLHGKAIEAMVQGGYNGTLFVNFLPGFIQKPDVYLEGLSREVQRHGLVPRRIALDLTEAELPRNRKQLEAIRDYCRKQGYHIVLDDIESPDEALKLIESLMPSFLKLSPDVVAKSETAKGKATLKRLIEICHANGVTVIAGRIETQETFDFLKALEVDLFQGYFIARPEQAQEPSALHSNTFS